MGFGATLPRWPARIFAVTAFMLACNVPISHSSDDVIEADYGEHTGGFGNYAIKTHVYVVAIDDSTTLVRLAGHETSKRGKALNPMIDTAPITNKNMGKSPGRLDRPP